MNTPFSAEALATFIQSVKIMFEGMAGIFVFMAIFYGLITVLNLIFTNKATKEI